MTEEGKEKLKTVGLEIAEEHAKMAIDDVYKIAEIFVDDTASPIDDGILAALKLLKGEFVKFADKINPKD